jgi:cell division protein FtsZ
MDLVDNALNNNYGSEDFFKANIAVAGVGGGGSNTVQRLSRMGIKGAALMAFNTDSKHLNTLDSGIKRSLIGGPLTRGMGAGGFPEMGMKAAEYSRSDIEAALNGVNLLFICAGMGGGTGTGAAPVVADVAKRNGSVVLGIVTFPFSLERVRINVAKKGIEELSKGCDTLIVIDNQRLVQLYPNLAIDQAFKVADEVAARAVRGITETINTPSLINLDYADVRNILNKGGLAMISIGEGHGTNKVEESVENTLRNKLLDVDYEKATNMLLHITGGEDMTLGEANEIGARLTDSISPSANVVWGARIDPAYAGKVEVIAIVTGVQSSSILGSERNERKGDFGLGEL